MDPQPHNSDNTEINKPDEQPNSQPIAGQTFNPTQSPNTSPTTAPVTADVDQPTSVTSPEPIGPTPQVIASTAPSSTATPILTPTASPAAVVSSFSPNAMSGAAPSQPQLVTSAQPTVFNPANPNNSSPANYSSGVPSAGMPVAGGASGGKRRRTLFAAVLVALIVVLGSGYAFAFYLPNTPDNIFKHGLSNTGLAYDKLTDYATTVSKQNYKGSKLNGTVNVDVGGVSGDGNFNFQSNGANATGALNVDIAGEKLNANVRSIKASGQTDPDVYFQVNGVKSVLDKYGYTALDSLDGKWISVDHTLITSVTNSVTKGDGSGATIPTPAEVQDALAKVGAVNNQYVFKADSSHAVLKENKYLGKSTMSGRSVYGYQVGYNRAHLQAYVAALGKALDSSSLNAWSKSANDGKSLSEALQFDDLKKQVASAKESYTFNMYVDAQTKLVADVHFTGDKPTDVFDIGQTYHGGDIYPFTMKVATDDDTYGKITLGLNVSLNSKTNEVIIGATFDGNDSGSPTKLSLQANIVPTNDAVNVTAPTGATPINNVIAQLGLGGDSSASSSANANASDDGLDSDLFTLTQ